VHQHQLHHGQFAYSHVQYDSDTLQYALLRPGASTYIYIPQALFAKGAAEEELKVNDLSQDLQRFRGMLPIAHTSTADKRYAIFEGHVRVADHLELGGNVEAHELHPKCRGARHYLALTNSSFYLIFRSADGKYVGASTSSLVTAADWHEFEVPMHLHAADGMVLFPSSSGGVEYVGVLRRGEALVYTSNAQLRALPNMDGVIRPIRRTNLCRQLQQEMSRVKVRLAVGTQLQTKVEVSPHLEYALQALINVQRIDPQVFRQALKVDSANLDQQSLLDILTDIGPRLQTDEDEVASDPVELALSKVVGLADVKAKIRALRQSLRLDARRQELGKRVNSISTNHMVFMGNPGTGKTSVARILVSVFGELGILKSGQLVEVQRDDLVGQYVGWTATKTRERIDAAKGGVLFVDEAYRLTSSGSRNDFGPEAVDEIMKDLTTGDPLVIVAGYGDEMERFLKSNPGLTRRFTHTFHFEDYTPLEIADIFLQKVEDSGFELSTELTAAAWRERIACTIEDHTTPTWRAKRNGGVAEALLTETRQALDSRLDVEASPEQLMTFQFADVSLAARKLQDV